MLLVVNWIRTHRIWAPVATKWATRVTRALVQAVAVVSVACGATVSIKIKLVLPLIEPKLTLIVAPTLYNTIAQITAAAKLAIFGHAQISASFIFPVAQERTCRCHLNSGQTLENFHFFNN